MTDDRFHIDRVSAYNNALPDDSGVPWFSETSDHSLLNLALCLACNLADPGLTAALAGPRALADSADDLERISHRADVDAPTRVSMLHVARLLRTHDAPKPEEPADHYAINLGSDSAADITETITQAVDAGGSLRITDYDGRVAVYHWHAEETS
ncbi:hypothetical protein [Nocardiopsis protaetiae]|uniref:hypothetical protein n=1 Tax=Nocardiopsis protaetiae TaxID=3382270 RepID=UPI00387AE368